MILSEKTKEELGRMVSEIKRKNLPIKIGSADELAGFLGAYAEVLLHQHVLSWQQMPTSIKGD